MLITLVRVCVLRILLLIIVLACGIGFVTEANAAPDIHPEGGNFEPDWGGLVGLL